MTRTMAASSLRERAATRRLRESPAMAANLLHSCEMSQVEPDPMILRIANDMHNMTRGKDGEADSASHNPHQELRIARRLGLRDFMRDAFDAIANDLKIALQILVIGKCI